MSNLRNLRYSSRTCPDSNFHGAHMGPTWRQQDPGGPHVGPMNLAIRVCLHTVITGTEWDFSCCPITKPNYLPNQDDITLLLCRFINHSIWYSRYDGMILWLLFFVIFHSKILRFNPQLYRFISTHILTYLACIRGLVAMIRCHITNIRRSLDSFIVICGNLHTDKTVFLYWYAPTHHHTPHPHPTPPHWSYKSFGRELSNVSCQYSFLDRNTPSAASEVLSWSSLSLAKFSVIENRRCYISETFKAQERYWAKEASNTRVGTTRHSPDTV